MMVLSSNVQCCIYKYIYIYIYRIILFWFIHGGHHVYRYVYIYIYITTYTNIRNIQEDGKVNRTSKSFVRAMRRCVCLREDVAPYAARRELRKCSGRACFVVWPALAATRCLSILINAKRFPRVSRWFLWLPVASRCVPAASRWFPVCSAMSIRPTQC